MMRFYVKQERLSHGQHGFVFSTANWDPYPMANDMEASTNALANMDVAVAQRIERFTDRGPAANCDAHHSSCDECTDRQFNEGHQR
jgi:hypothetical protein